MHVCIYLFVFHYFAFCYFFRCFVCSSGISLGIDVVLHGVYLFVYAVLDFCISFSLHVVVSFFSVVF